jgi:hypothetical protein
MVTTKHRGVFAGLVPADQDRTAETIKLIDARMAIYWATSKGVHELAYVGPNADSIISSPADVTLHGITAVFEVTDAAWEAWVSM